MAKPGVPRESLGVASTSSSRSRAGATSLPPLRSSEAPQDPGRGRSFSRPRPGLSVSDRQVPELISRYLERSLPAQSPPAVMVRVRQRGEMQLEPDARPRRTSAVQDYAVDEVAFTWRARLRRGPFPLLRVVDRYIDGRASLQGRSLGLLRLDGESSADTSVAQALLYLAELPWVPHAMRDNRRLEWGQVDHRSVEVATRVGSQRAVVRLEFDPAGDIIASRSRPRGRTRSGHRCRGRGEPISGPMRRSAASAFQLVARCAGSCPTVPSRIGAPRSPRSKSDERRRRHRTRVAAVVTGEGQIEVDAVPPRGLCGCRGWPLCAARAARGRCDGVRVPGGGPSAASVRRGEGPSSSPFGRS